MQDINLFQQLIRRFTLATMLAAIAISLVAAPAQASIVSVTSGESGDPKCAGFDAAAAERLGAITAPDVHATEHAPVDSTLRPAPPAVQVPAGTGLYGTDWPITSDTTVTYIEGGLTHTTRTTVQRGVRPGMSVGSLSGKLAAPLSTACSYTGSIINTQQATVCGAGCMTAYMRRTYDTYTQGTSNSYYARKEVRLWWDRQYSAGIDFSSPAYTQWNESFLWDCNGTSQGRQVYAYTASQTATPVWQTWDRTYDYYWDESYLPIVTPTPSGYALYVYTDTPTTWGTTLHTEISLR